MGRSGAGRRGHEGEGGRATQRAAGPLDRPAQQQRRRRAGRRADERPRCEQRHPGGERPDRPEPVGDESAHQQAASEHEGIAVDDPGQARRREAKSLLDRRQRDDHDRGVGDHHEVRHRGDEHRRPR